MRAKNAVVVAFVVCFSLYLMATERDALPVALDLHADVHVDDVMLNTTKRIQCET